MDDWTVSLMDFGATMWMVLVPTIVAMIKDRVTVGVYDVENGNVWKTVCFIYHMVYDSLENLILLIKKDEAIYYSV